MASSEDAFLQGNRAPVRVKTLIKHTSHFQSYIQVTIKAGPARGQHYCMCICQWVSGCPKVGCLDICLYYSPVTSSKAHNLNIQFQSQVPWLWLFSNFAFLFLYHCAILQSGWPGLWLLIIARAVILVSLGHETPPAVFCSCCWARLSQWALRAAASAPTFLCALCPYTAPCTPVPMTTALEGQQSQTVSNLAP